MKSNLMILASLSILIIGVFAHMYHVKKKESEQRQLIANQHLRLVSIQSRWQAEIDFAKPANGSMVYRQIKEIQAEYNIFSESIFKNNAIVDFWGHPLRYKDGTIYSIGPNGIDEFGGGDDILPLCVMEKATKNQSTKVEDSCCIIK